MRLTSYLSKLGPAAGLVRDGRLLDAAQALDAEGPLGMRGLLASDLLADLETSDIEGVALSEVELLPPVPDPEKIICIGLNYRSHAAEAGIDPPESPTIFAKYRNALAPAGTIVALPEASAKVDYEAEIAFVIGRRATGVAEADALDHVAGYTLFNDLSARDLQFATPQWMPGKVFDSSAPCGPTLVTPSDAGPADAIEFKLKLNGEEMQAARTDDLIFGVAQLVAQLSKLMTLEVGDVVATGTPSGVGGAREPRVWLKPGDEIVISSPTLGELTTHIA